ncbi:MAG: nucleotidyltransferase family protein [Gammaproteobacteria bacterium]|nr:nucleotidyltransferase family protein [Gammaproteobacteria bacterium]
MTLFPVVILAGGLATRLRPVTVTIPKALVKINGEPFVTHQLRLLQKNGIRNVIMCLGYLGEQIVEFVGNGEKYGLNVSYVFDGPTLLGTAGAIKNAIADLPEHFFVLNGDSYLPCDYQAVQKAFVKSNRLALMTVFKNEGLWDTSNVEFDNDRIVTYDKQNRNSRMLHIDYGLEIFSKQVFVNIPDNQASDLTPIYQDLIKIDQLAAYEVHERFYENGSFSGIAELESYLEA